MFVLCVFLRVLLYFVKLCMFLQWGRYKLLSAKQFMNLDMKFICLRTPYNSIICDHLPLYYSVLCLFYQYFMYLSQFWGFLMITYRLWTRFNHNNPNPHFSILSSLLSLYIL